MKRKTLIITLFLAVMLCSCVYAADNQAEINSLRLKILKIQNSGELGIANLNVCSSISSYGDFTPKNNQVKSGVEFLVYFEPLNVFTKIDSNGYTKYITQDIQILSTEGKVLFQKKKFLDFNMTSKKPVSELFVRNKFKLTAPPGTYLYKVILHDKLRGTSASKSMKIRVIK